MLFVGCLCPFRVFCLKRGGCCVLRLLLVVRCLPLVVVCWLFVVCSSLRGVGCACFMCVVCRAMFAVVVGCLLAVVYCSLAIVNLFDVSRCLLLAMLV